MALEFIDNFIEKFMGDREGGAERSEATRKEKQAIKELQDFLAPSAIEIESNHLQINDKYCKTLFISSYPSSINTGWLGIITSLNDTFDVSIHIHPEDTGEVLKDLTSRLARLRAEMSERQEQGKVESPLLQSAEQEIIQMRDQLQTGQERFFRVGIYVTIYADSEEKLKDLAGELKTRFTNLLMDTREATFKQEKGFNSSLPLAYDQLLATEPLNTSPLSASFPFLSADLTSDSGILYGINRDKNSLIIFDRFSLENANSIIIGQSGGGKSYCAKLEILRSLMFGTDILIIDPENEYEYLAETVGGSYFYISLTSDHHINPFDLPDEIPKDKTPREVLQENVIELMGIMKVLIGDLTPEEDSLMDNAIRETYASRGIRPETDFTDKTPPTIEDLQNVLENTEGGESLAKKLEKYTTGRFGGFLNNQTNVDLDSNMVVFNIRDMEDELRPVAMYIILHYIWKKVRKKLKKRLLFVDEAWWMLEHEDSAKFLFSLAKRARKYYLGLTTITQDIADFTKSKYGEPILTNSSMQILFKQSPATIDKVKEVFNLTDTEKNMLLEVNVGQGLFFAGLKHASIYVTASYSEDQIITSDPKEILEIEKAKKELQKNES